MNLKASVKLAGVRPEMLMGVIVAESIWREAGKLCTITSCNDSAHGLGSLHFGGAAVDLRTRDLTVDQAETFTALLKKRLTAEFDVVLESDHIHLEYQPKVG